MKLNKYITALCVLGTSVGALAQEANTLYFMKHNPVRHEINPAFMPEGYTVYVGLGISDIDLYVGTNSYVFDDLGFVDKKGYVHTIFDEDWESSSIKDLINEAHRNVRLDFYNENTLLGFGFKTKKDVFFSFGVRTKTEGHISVPKKLLQKVYTFDKTNPADQFKNFTFKDLNIKELTYLEYNFGMARKTDNLQLGIKFKFLSGIAYTKSKIDNLDIKLGDEKWSIDAHGNVYLVLPVTRIYENDKGFELVTSYDDLSTKQIRKPSGHGAAIDFGFSSSFLDDHLTLSASLLDLGFISWRRNVSEVWVSLDNYSFQNPNLSENTDNVADINDNISDSFSAERIKGMYGVDDKNQKSAVFLSPKVHAGLEYSFPRDKVSLGLLTNIMFVNGDANPSLTFSSNFRPHRFVEWSLSYDFIKSNLANLGAGINLNLGPLNIFAAIDDVPLKWSDKTSDGTRIPRKTSQVRLSTGVNFLFGWNTRRKDDDHDGVKNRRDMCPDTPAEVNGLVDEWGCPKDTDGDGVPDYLDQCENTPEEAYGKVGENGCPLDTDGDGVPDYLDKCPNTPVEAFGMIDESGCPKDSDGDGVPDYLDKCADTPLSVVLRVDESGCPFDEDQDGVPDYLDKCPGTLESARGMVDENGCATDTDGDGVPDFKDKCPGTPEKAWGHVDENGCPKDSDNDGVPDYLDNCPNIAGTTANHGCPEIKASVKKLFQKALNGIQFETGKSKIKSSSFSILNQIVRVLQENKEYKLKIHGHTDSQGKYETNLKLSRDRADAVKNYLIDHGVDYTRLSSDGFGPDQPVADNKTSKGRALNRRVEFIVEFEQEVAQ